MNVFKSRFGYFFAVSRQHVHVVPLGFKILGDYLEVHRKHFRHEYFIGLFHFLGERNIIELLFHCLFSLSSIAPSRLRSLIFTLPRFVISSILSCV